MIDLENQRKHKPTRDWLDIVYKYAKKSNFKKALDIGTGGGLTSMTLLQAGDGDIVSVDIKKNDKLLKSDRITYLYNGERPDEMFDIIIIDGDHSYEGVKKDIEYAWKHARKYIVCDDYSHKRYGVKKALDKFGEPKIEKGKAIYEKVKKRRKSQGQED